MPAPTDPENSAGPRLGDVLDAIHDAVAIFDGEGRLSLLNVAGRLLLGLPLDRSLDGLLLSDLLPEDEAERFVHECLPIALQRGEWSGHAYLKMGTGVPIRVRARLVAHAYEAGDFRGFTLVAPDENAREPATRVDELGLVLQAMHDINNLLGPIRAHAELAQAELDVRHPTHDRLQLIREAAESARALCRQVSAKRRPSTWRVVDLAQIAEEVVAWLRAEFPRASVHLTKNAARAEVFCDARELERVLVNLCRNAVESLPQSGGAVRLSLSLREHVRRVRLTVSDDGCGISRDRLETIFEPHRSTKGAGRGLGLTLAREIVRGHGGSLEIESTLAAGTEVHVELPLHVGSTLA